MDDQPPADRPPEGRWLTYTDAAQLLGISSEELRSLARRHRWDRRSSNAVGGHSWVLVPADRLPAAGREETSRRLLASPSDLTVPPTDNDLHRPPVEPPPTAGHDADDLRSNLRYADDPRPTDRHDDRRLEEILTAVRSLGEAVTALGTQLIRERERADRAENRAAEAETRNKELQEQHDALQNEVVEHRRVIGVLADQLAARQSWWSWRFFRRVRAS